MSTKHHLFFDLDRTIWDYENNSRETLEDLWENHIVNRSDITAVDFINVFREENTLLWDLFTRNQIDKEFLRKERFYRTINRLGINDRNLGLVMEEHYIEHTPSKKLLLPGARETLEQLSSGYRLHIITNGFEDVQNFKLSNCQIDHFFEQVITSDGAGARKPNKEIFDYALKRSGAGKEYSIMIGDDPEIDIAGALNAGWKNAILVNTMKLPNPYANVDEVASLPDLLEIL